jgi:HAD superfamily hydrolase (TIGR01509 family)
MERYGLEKESLFCEIYQPHMKPLNGLVPFLTALKQNGIKTAVATSAPEGNVDLILNGLSLKCFFDTVINESMVTRSKPDPEIYLLTAQKLGVSPSECVVFEDSLAGTKAALDAGCKVVALITTLPASKHKYYHHLITDFDEISVNFILSEFFT